MLSIGSRFSSGWDLPPEAHPTIASFLVRQQPIRQNLSEGLRLIEVSHVGGAGNRARGGVAHARGVFDRTLWRHFVVFAGDEKRRLSDLAEPGRHVNVFDVPVMVNSLGPFMYPYTPSPRPSKALFRSSGQGSDRHRYVL